MDVYIARQPILDIHKNLYGYELLYRGTKELSLANIGGDRATSSLLSTTFFTEGIEVISGTKPCFVNFTEDLILKNIPQTFSKDKITVEILEDVRPSKEVVEACYQLRKKGYRLALDDFVYRQELDPLIKLAEIIKIDLQQTPLDTIFKTIDRLADFEVKLLAEKVETPEDFEKAKKLGFCLFQGYFFCRPQKILIKELVSAKISLINLLAEVSSKSTSIEKLHHIISKDVAISYKLLHFLNSAFFYRLQEVKDVKHAIAYLGEEELRRFILLVIVSKLAIEQPGELTRQALVRAKFCELLAQGSRLKKASSEIFLMGMLSLIDTMLDTPMKDVMEKLPLAVTVKEALISGSGKFAPILKAVIAYEQNKFEHFEDILKKNDIKVTAVAEMFIQSALYANGF